jgi:glycosyltransferase involved in cell wall biosynthesis
MQIGVDANCWANRRGYGRFTRELLHALLREDRRNTYWFFLDAGTKSQAAAIPDDVKQVVVPTSRAAVEAASASGRRSVRDLWTMSQAVRRHRPALDLFYFPSVYTFYPLRIKAPVAVSIHDTIPERYPELVFTGRVPRLMWTLKVRWAVRQAAVTLTVTETSRRAIAEHFRLPDSRVRVVPDAASPIFRVIDDLGQGRQVLARHGILREDRYILYVGGISPHKNLATLLEAYAMLTAERSDGPFAPKLVLAGDYRLDVFLSSYPALQRKIEESRLAERVLFTGYVTDEELVCLYNSAALLVLPSFDEGFGLPAVEAMACGTPVVASRAGALPEVVGDAGVLFDPYSPAELKRCLEELLRDDSRRAALRARGLRRAGDFSWDRSAAAALAIFEETARR